VDILNLERGKGKTTYLLMRSHMKRIPILVYKSAEKDFIKSEAKDMGLDIPEPLSVNDLIGDNSRGKVIPQSVLVDEMPLVLQSILGVKIDTATMTERDNF
jgi:hypothetical protein